MGSSNLSLDRIRDVVLPALLPHGVTRLAIFGSYARGEAGPESDLDLLVTYKEPRVNAASYYEWTELIDDLAAKLGCKVDIAPTNYMYTWKKTAFEEGMVVLYTADCLGS